MRVRYTVVALEEIAQLLEYIGRDNRAAAGDIAEAIEHTIAMIVEQPRLARVIYPGQVRAFPIDRFRYRIFYQVGPDEIVVRNVRSMRRQRPWENGRE